MPKKSLRALRIAGPARQDISQIVRWSLKHFGDAAASRYEALITQAFHDLQTDPLRPGSKERPELMKPGVRTYHLFFSRDHVAGIRVREPRHFIIYRSRSGGVLEIGRVLHDGCDIKLHLPKEYRPAE